MAFAEAQPNNLFLLTNFVEVVLFLSGLSANRLRQRELGKLFFLPKEHLVKGTAGRFL